MRKWFIFVILLLFNFFLIYGINQANMLMFNNNFMIYVHPKEEKEEPNEDEPEPIIEEDDVLDTDYNGESVEKIAHKIDKYCAKTPLEGHGEHIAKISIKKSVNPYLIGGIILESTSCKTECSIIFQECNNVSKMKGEPGCFGGVYKNYNSVNDAIADLVSYISKEFYTPEMQAPYKMYKAYGKTSSWAFKVSNYMDAIKRTK